MMLTNFQLQAVGDIPAKVMKKTRLFQPCLLLQGAIQSAWDGSSAARN
jgi:hypothetical protein